MKKSDKEYILLSVQAALFGAVVPALRAVMVRAVHRESCLYLQFFYDCKVTDEILDICSCATVEVDVPGFEHADFQATMLAPPASCPIEGDLVYHRYEDNFHPPMLNLEPELDQPYYPSLVAQQVLLGVVTPSLRGVFTHYQVRERRTTFCFVYDGEVTESLKHLADSAVNRARTAFPDNFEIIAKIERLDFPNRLNDGFFERLGLSEKTRTAYRRREP